MLSNSSKAAIGICLLSVIATANAEPKAKAFWDCIKQTENISGLHKDVIVAIKIVESGARLDSPIRHNSNGTVDVGIMQTNSIWFPSLQANGIAPYMLNDNCVSIKVAAWMLIKHLKATRDLWEAVGIYHSSTPHLKESYRHKVRQVYQYLRNKRSIK